jgi:glycolate oxidase FAD binding subunit
MTTLQSSPGSIATIDPARFAIGGTAPRAALRPRDRNEVAGAMSWAAREGLAVVPWGGGVALAAEPSPSRYDVALDLSALDRIVEYDPEDLTLTAEAGITVAALREALAARGQELPLEGAHASRATLGGLLAADTSGPRRLRFGAPHDRILGARFVLADGTIARSGGKVVKNVAGYATHRLLCGSCGGLAAIVEASLKLAPAPEERAALCFDLDAARLSDAATWAWLPRLEPAFATVIGSAAAEGLPPAARGTAPFTVIVGLEDDRRRVAEQEAAVVRALGTPRARLAGDQVVGLAQSAADLEECPGERLSFTTTGNTPAALAQLLGLPAGAGLVFHAPAGRLHLFPERDDAPEALVRAAAAGFVLRAARGIVAPGAPARAGVLALRARIRAGLDPAGAFALGERWAGGGV